VPYTGSTFARLVLVCSAPVGKVQAVAGRRHLLPLS
jgi:hypothetical protein